MAKHIFQVYFVHNIDSLGPVLGMIFTILFYFFDLFILFFVFFVHKQIIKFAIAHIPNPTFDTQNRDERVEQREEKK